MYVNISHAWLQVADYIIIRHAPVHICIIYLCVFGQVDPDEHKPWKKHSMVVKVAKTDYILCPPDEASLKVCVKQRQYIQRAHRICRYISVMHDFDKRGSEQRQKATPVHHKHRTRHTN